MEQSDILSPSQYGTIQENMDKCLFSCSVFIDLKKAFDTVDHKVLLHRLDYYGFHGVINKWFILHVLGWSNLNYANWLLGI